MFENAEYIDVAVWIGLFVVFVVVEGITTSLVTIWFAAAAVPTIFLALLGVPINVQVLSFIIMSLILLILSKRYLKSPYAKGELSTNVDAIIGKMGIAKEEISKDKKGYAKVEGLDWLCFTNSNEIIRNEDKVIVKAVSGAKLEVEKYKNTEEV